MLDFPNSHSSAFNARRLRTPDARIGLIIPSSNRLTEPQFCYYTPPEIAVHIARLRMSGKWRRTLAEMSDDIREATSILADTKPDLIVFHCTGTSMHEGMDGNFRILEIMREATDVEVISTCDAVVEALRALHLKRLVLVTPCKQPANDEEKAYLEEQGFTVVRDIGLELNGSDDYIAVPVQRWIDVAAEQAACQFDGFFLSCTNTTQIEAIHDIEQRTGKPVVNSNQAVLWACLNRLRINRALDLRPPEVGRLMRLI